VSVVFGVFVTKPVFNLDLDHHTPSSSHTHSTSMLHLVTT
jgi:hypothetical protein